jgi:hypothetical protein
MEMMKIPKFENESDEANSANEHRDQFVAAFMSQFLPNERKRNTTLESVLKDALKMKELLVAPEEKDGNSSVMVLRLKLDRSRLCR